MSWNAFEFSNQKVCMVLYKCTALRVHNAQQLIRTCAFIFNALLLVQ